MNLHGKRRKKTLIGRFGWFAKPGFGKEKNP
jgi:hypothetical protein